MQQGICPPPLISKLVIWGSFSCFVGVAVLEEPELTNKLVNEEADCDDIEDKEVEDVLTVLLQKICPDVPLF